MKGERKEGWLEPGDMVKAGDFKVLKTGEWSEVKQLTGFVHKSHHAPVWRPAAKTPTIEERRAMLAISTEIINREEEEKRDRYERGRA